MGGKDTDTTTDDERYFLHGGRRWRRADPSLPDDVGRRLLSHLGRARAEVGKRKRAGEDTALAAARARVQLAKTGLGERGDPWWEQTARERRDRWTSALEDLDALAAPDD
ncbi:biopolymer transporter Tol [Arthrobacter halodurans]|uniref:Biopolymer transporter Tol n=1 Tax=Arthrobacter halodurans TaxID=516699 RepID=A0ABV4UNR1_9MICC